MNASHPYQPILSPCPLESEQFLLVSSGRFHPPPSTHSTISYYSQAEQWWVFFGRDVLVIRKKT